MSPNLVLRHRRMELVDLHGLANLPAQPVGFSVAPWLHTHAPKIPDAPSTPRPTAPIDKRRPYALFCIVLRCVMIRVEGP